MIGDRRSCMGRNENDEDTMLLDYILKIIFKKCLIFCSGCKLSPLNNVACDREPRDHENGQGRDM